MNFNDIKGVGGRMWERFKKGGENFLCKKEKKIKGAWKKERTDISQEMRGQD